MFQVIEWKRPRVPRKRKGVKKLFIRYFIGVNIVIIFERGPTKRDFFIPFSTTHPSFW
jgi:hypothetical protein